MPPAGCAENTGRRGSLCAEEPHRELLPLEDRVHRSRGSSWRADVLTGIAALVALSCLPARAADPERYLIFDPLFLQRNQAAVDRPLVVSSKAPERSVLSAGDLESSIGTGVRLVYGDYGVDGVGWEGAYIGVWGMYASDAVIDSAGTLQAAGGLGFANSGLDAASVARASVRSTLDSAELNLVFHEYDGGFDPAAGRPEKRYPGYDGGHLDWLAGFRWAGFGEQAVLGFTQDGNPGPSTYQVETFSNLFAVQTGVRGRIVFERWAFEGWMKVAMAGAADFQAQSMFDQLAPGDPYRGPRSRRLGGMGMIADMNISTIYRLNDVWGLRLGYNLLWLTGVALAPDQFDFSASEAGGRGLNTTGSVFLAGANLGLEARW